MQWVDKGNGENPSRATQDDALRPRRKKQMSFAAFFQESKTALLTALDVPEEFFHAQMQASLYRFAATRYLSAQGTGMEPKEVYDKVGKLFAQDIIDYMKARAKPYDKPPDSLAIVASLEAQMQGWLSAAKANGAKSNGHGRA